MRTDAEPEPEAEPDHRRSHRVVLILMGISLVIGAAWAIGPILFASHDDPTAIDSRPVRYAVQTACTRLRADLAAIPPSTPPAERAEEENQAVDRLLTTVRAVGPALDHDHPVPQWLDDWQRILDARKAAMKDGKRFAV
ncbi:MAG TPA: hypothetical protein VHL53_19015, partial [Acidimicrobiia bacterium]|nr:hypothetical protein [Acidimicrobiia bacterium]